MKITRFENLAEKAVPWFIAVCLFVILWAVTGCREDFRTDRQPSFDTIEIEGCEYFKWYSYYSFNMTHKGNCKNRIHKCE